MKRQYPLPDGHMVEGEEVEFEVDKEGFNIYILHDGTKLKIKSVVSQIIRLDAYGPNGDPMYMVNAQQIMAADVPDSLKRKP